MATGVQALELVMFVHPKYWKREDEKLGSWAYFNLTKKTLKKCYGIIVKDWINKSSL